MATYQETLRSANRKPVSQQTEAELMAGWCDSVLQIAYGAYSPRLVWEGAQKRGMTTLQLNQAAERDRSILDDLMFGD